MTSTFAPISSSDRQRSEFRYEINALRALAVLSVVGFHFGIPGFAGGFSGVDVFFVISGFLMTSQILDGLKEGRFSYFKFYVSRLRRIFPALLVVCVAALTWGWFFYLPKDFINVSRHAASSVFFVSNIAFDGERGYFDAAAITKSLLHTWSLSVEWQFYIFLPVFLSLAFRFFGKYLPAISIVVFTCAFLFSIYVDATSPGKGFYLLLPRIWEFFSGVVLAHYRNLKITNWQGSALSALGILGILGILASLALIDSSIPWPSAWTLLPISSTVLVIVSGNSGAARGILMNYPLQRIGDISYSLYLWHWPIWVFLNDEIWSGMKDGRFWNIGAGIALSLLMAFLSWRYVEQPVRQAKGWGSNRKVFFASLFSALLVFCFGLAAVVTNGFAERLPFHVKRAAEATFVNTPRDECFRRGDSSKDSPENFCTFGNVEKSSASIVLWGDSHANQYLSAVSDAATELGLAGIIATQSGCSARMVLLASNSCDKFNQEVYEHIISNSSLQTIVLGRIWGDEDSANYSTALIQDLVRKGRRVILLGPLPSPGFDVPDRWAKQQIKLGESINSMSLSVSSQALAFFIQKKLLNELGALIDKGAVVYIDPLSTLCDKDECRLVEGGWSNYRDESHLSHRTSLRFKNNFLLALQKTKNPN